MEIEKNKVFVNGLDYSIDNEGLAALFSDIEGIEIKEAKVIMDRDSGRSKGFGFVTFGTDEMAQQAIDAMNGKEISGRALFVNIARPQEKRDNNNRSGSGSYGRRF